ncbi:hypothetical protein O0I10_012370 [Lichtheimia ornata]|uniref:C2H2-type domain-containing protein n=1 Tax=Lichtheimia ornata TaxID=688661 RepID=A0AAD7XT97_9FUNG|nr:uncharacterized protein O0I10_012370 [Lichtheimia ornata]KAJ8652026.1 hypothetical protein O0I10_012370 [Lichtheimia ornata]
MRSPHLAALSVIDAQGRHVSLLNDIPEPIHHHSYATIHVGKRRYHCNNPGCNKSFTTSSSHLSRHKRIHTGERNFHCLYPGCPSRFSRQDNMMQHYRTHMAPRSRRKQHHPYPYPSSSPESTSSIHTRGTTIHKMIMAPVPLKHAFICSDALYTVYRPCSPPLPSPPLSPPPPSLYRNSSLFSATPPPRTLEPAIESSPLIHSPLKHHHDKHIPSSSSSSFPTTSNLALHRHALKSFG